MTVSTPKPLKKDTTKYYITAVGVHKIGVATKKTMKRKDFITIDFSKKG